MKKEEQIEVKKNNYLLVIIIALVFIVGLGTGYIAAKKDILKSTSETKTEEKKDAGNKEETKKEEEVKEEKKKEEEKEEDNKVEEETKKTNNHNCAICDEEGDICCAIGPNGDANDVLTVTNDQDSITTEGFEITNNNHSYNLVYKKSNGIEKVIINNKTIFSESYIVEKIFVLDDGLIGVQYYDDNDQAKLKKRNYYDTKLNKLETIEGIKSSVDIFSREYEYTVMGNECINDSYHELKIYKAVIGNNNVTTSLVKTEKEDGCAGLT